MVLATGTLTFALTDLVGLIGESIDPSRVRVWIESNLPDGAVVDTAGNIIRLGNPTADLSAAGTGSFAGLPLTTFVTGMQYRVAVEYPDAGTMRRKTWSSGWFDFPASGDLADQDMQSTAAPITWQTAFTDSMEAIVAQAQAYRDEARDVANIDTPDALVAALVSPTSGTLTAAALNGAFADKAATTTALSNKIATALIGAANGVASLGPDQKVPAAQLPSYVDDVLEYATKSAFPATGETGKIYTDLATSKIWRWSGSTYIEISPSPGSTDSVAEGSTNLYFTTARAASAAPVQSVAGRTGAVTLTKSDVGLTNVDNTSDASKPVSTATQNALNLKVDSSLLGAASGVATLGSDGKLTPAQVPATSSGTTVAVRTTGSGGASSATSFSIALPAGIVAGDLMLLAITSANAAAAVSGWSVLASAASGTSENLVILGKTAVGGEGGTTVTATVSTASAMAWSCLILSGVSEVNAGGGTVAASTTTVATGALTNANTKHTAVIVGATPTPSTTFTISGTATQQTSPTATRPSLTTWTRTVALLDAGSTITASGSVSFLAAAYLLVR